MSFNSCPFCHLSDAECWRTLCGETIEFTCRRADCDAPVKDEGDRCPECQAEENEAMAERLVEMGVA